MSLLSCVLLDKLLHLHWLSVFSYIEGTALNILLYAFCFFIYIWNCINWVVICANKNLISIILWCASLIAQFVKNLPAMQKTCVWSLGWEDPLEKGKATFSSILTWRIPWLVESMGLPDLDTTEQFSLMKWINSAKVRSKKKKKRKHDENKWWQRQPQIWNYDKCG